VSHSGKLLVACVLSICLLLACYAHHSSLYSMAVRPSDAKKNYDFLQVCAEVSSYLISKLMMQIISNAWKERERERVRERERSREDDSASASERDPGSVFSVPLGRVYEMRGTILMETQGLKSAPALSTSHSHSHSLKPTPAASSSPFI
jgi:hypothetical protein